MFGTSWGMLGMFKGQAFFKAKVLIVPDVVGLAFDLGPAQVHVLVRIFDDVAVALKGHLLSLRIPH